VRLGLGCLLPRVLRHRALLDADQGFAVGAVEDVDPSRAASFGNPFARLSVDNRVERDHRARGVAVPGLAVNALDAPAVLTAPGLQGDGRGAEQVVTLAHRAVIVRAAIADREVNEPEFWVQRRRIPDCRSAAHRMVGAGWPGLAPDLAWAG